MNVPRYRNLLVLFVLALVAISPLLISMQRAPDGSDATLKAIAAAQAFLATLDEHQRNVIKVDLNKDTRIRWSNLPTGIAPYPRNGIRLGDMTAVQQEAAFKLVAAALSPAGFQKVMNIVNGDEVFKTMAPSLRFRENTAPVFGRGEFYVAILGAP